MQSLVVIAQRSVSAEKHSWREPSFRRTIDEVDSGRIIRGAWRRFAGENTDRGVVLADLDDEMPPLEMRSIQGPQMVRAGVFQIKLESSNLVAVSLDKNACASELGSPNRPAFRLCAIAPWQPIRVLINGRRVFKRGTYYNLRDYYVVLCTDPEPESLAQPKLFDFQKDLY